MPSECRGSLVRVRSWMERYQQLTVAAAVALFLCTSRRHARASVFCQLTPLSTYFWWMRRSVGWFVKIDSSHPFSAFGRWSQRARPTNATLHRRAGPKPQRFGRIPREEFSDDRSCSRRLSRNRTLLLVTSQLRPCVLCVYRSEQPISHSIIPLLSGFGSALTLDKW